MAGSDETPQTAPPPPATETDGETDYASSASASSALAEIDLAEIDLAHEEPSRFAVLTVRRRTGSGTVGLVARVWRATHLFRQKP
jgi:hypothetical protein